MPATDWDIEPLHKSHERQPFSSGKPPLDTFLHHLARQYEKRRLGRTYVAVRRGDKRVFGYYTLAAGSVAVAHVPPELSAKLPRHPVPVVLLARLAVDQSVQRQGLGRLLLTDALKRSWDLSRQMGIHAIEVDVIDGPARDFYEKYGFVALRDNDLHLYLPVASLDRLFGAE